ncbi:uncharacterized protein LOC130924406 [Corythoichthys intestinalis]|uniref:uncharacterized protein LOC130924406 n=1 Tax=Corythoichthys intestinalis TaxID=161448 RepID=UPI0025A5ACAB|nr:uncharacterized protein LOC130924406 [Corythoichthys intestinalis]
MDFSTPGRYQAHLAADLQPVQGAVGPSPEISFEQLQRSETRRRSSVKGNENMAFCTPGERPARLATSLQPVQGAVGPSPGISCDGIQRPETRRRSSMKGNITMDFSKPEEHLAYLSTDWQLVQGAVSPSHRFSCDGLQRPEGHRMSSVKENEKMDFSTPGERLARLATSLQPVQGAVGPSPGISCNGIQRPETRRRSSMKGNETVYFSTPGERIARLETSLSSVQSAVCLLPGSTCDRLQRTEIPMRGISNGNGQKDGGLKVPYTMSTVTVAVTIAVMTAASPATVLKMKLWELHYIFLSFYEKAFSKCNGEEMCVNDTLSPTSKTS